MADGLFDLKTIASGQAEPVGGNRLVIGGQQVATVKKGLLGSSTRAVRECSTVKDIWQGRAEEIADLDGLSIEAQRAVGAAGSNKPDETFLVIAFDDGAFDDAYWVLQGDVVDVGSAASALSEPTGAAATAGPSSSAPPRPHGARKPLLIIVMAGVALIGVLAAVIFVLLAPASDDSGSEATPEPAEQAVESDERGAPAEAAGPVEASSLERGPFEPGVRFLVNVSGTREDARLRANSQGRVTEILR